MPSQEPFSHTRRNQILLWSAALSVITLGIYLSITGFMGNEWLSRSGCLVVILGIWSGLGGVIQERLLVSRLRWRRRNALIQARARLEAQQVDPTSIEKEIGTIEEGFDQQSAELTHKLKLSIGVLEVSLLITGTFLWGFGDLLV